MKTLRIVEADDWSALYVNNECVFQGHSICPKTIVDIANKSAVVLEYYDVKENYERNVLCQVGSFPEDFNKIGLKNLNKYK